MTMLFVFFGINSNSCIDRYMGKLYDFWYKGKGDDEMYDVKIILEQELQYQQNLKQVYLGKMNGLPEGNLSIADVHGHTYYYNRVNGKRIYLGNQEKNQTIAQMKAHKLLSTCVQHIDSNEKLFRHVIEKYRDVHPELVRSSLGKAYQDAEIDVQPGGMSNYEDWGYQEYQRSTKYPEGLVHRTLKGDYVRSKSEVVIANTIHMKNLQYRSEELTQVGKHIFAPDFKILIPRTGRTKILEHFGMMDNPEYRERALWKMSTYIENGYRPYEDILFTFDDLNGTIDAKNLDILITNFCK